ncbi:MAG: LysM peptidoglycan-binding domain-containing M23 family metallopeptidase [Myxococcota bacterium]
MDPQGGDAGAGHRRVPRKRAGPRLALALLCLALLGQPLLLGCTSKTPGLIHHVAASENLYRIGLRYGVEPQRIARANGIRDVRSLRVGQRLFIPAARGRTKVVRAGGASGRAQTPDMREARQRARASARQQTSLSFSWPVRGRLSSSFGWRRGRSHEGIDIAASRGTAIFAAESGRVIHSGRMGGYGRVVIVKHAGSYRTVYAHASRLMVRKGDFVERGQKIAEVGTTGRSTGPHVHFEIRRRESPQNPLGFLP